jgi:hypothetical protein
MAQELWSRAVAEGDYIESRLATLDSGEQVILVTGYTPSPDEPVSVYVDVPLNIAGHQEVYRVHAQFTGEAALAFASVEELTV